MNQACQCPSSTELRELLESTGSNLADSSDVIAHLDDCRSCQQSLEALASGEGSFTSTHHLEMVPLSVPGSDSAYWPALRKVEQEGSMADAAVTKVSRQGSLTFLNPPEDGSHLGSLGNFNLIKVIGRGGMGVVFQAIDTCLQRDVAIKVLDPELSRDELASTRFCREARAAASISHENVVVVHQVEYDEEKEIPFLVMDLISGESLDRKLEREGRLSLREIVSIGMQTAAGLAAAHDKGLIHRDIKPGNILLERSGQRVKLTDFGLARASEDARLTRTGMVAGTPLYMSPEQVNGEQLDARSDLFSLGVVLYELAAGEPPFNGKTPLAVLKGVAESQPVPLHERNPELPEWFIHTVDRLLAKKPAERYQTAREVANDLEHFWALLKSSEAWACPKKRAAHVRKAVALGTLAGLGTVLLGALGLFFLMPPRQQVDAKIPTPAHLFKGTSGPIWSMAISRDGKYLAMGTNEGMVKFWDIQAEKVVWTLNAHKAPITGVALSPRGDWLVTGSDDGHAILWDLKTQKEIVNLPLTSGVQAVAFDPEGQKLVIGCRNGTVKVWDVISGMEIPIAIVGHTGNILAVSFGPDGKTIATASADKTIKIWDTATGRLMLTLTGHEGGVYGLAFAPTGRYLASGSWDRTVRIWDLDSGSQLARLEGHTQDIWSTAFNADGTLIASAGEDRMVRLWNVETKKECAAFRGSDAVILQVQFTPESDALLAAGKDGTARMWNLSTLHLSK